MIALEGIEGARRLAVAHDTELALYVPKDDVAEPELSIVIPALNEEAVIAQFMDWCHKGIAAAGVEAEILIIDSSDDDTPRIVLEKGGRVLKAPRRGLGRAYIDAIPIIRGRWVILGDADCTYDFRHIAPFVEKLRGGAEYVMGSRFAGYIEDGAMPKLHRYFGTPLTSAILNIIYRSRFSDIHCGMRALTLDAFLRLEMVSQSWQYASEMIIKAVRLKLKTDEVPVRFYKDRDGRVSHHKRMGWFSPWQAGWINLQTMLVHGADFFSLKPGLLLFLLGILATVALARGSVEAGGMVLSLNSQMVGGTIAVVGLQLFFLGAMAETLYDTSGEAARRWTARFAYTPVALASASAVVAGLLLAGRFVMAFIEAENTVTPAMVGINHGAVAGLIFIILGILTFISTLLLHALAEYRGRKGT